MRFAMFALAASIAAGAVAVPGGNARAADISGAYVEDPGICGQAWVLHKITARFRHQVTHVPNLPKVAITNFSGIHQHRYLPAYYSYYEEWPIGRRYCGATVSLSDGDSREIWYLIEEGQGFASIGNNVEFCVSGFDRWYVYNGRCRVLR